MSFVVYDLLYLLLLVFDVGCYYSHRAAANAVVVAFATVAAAAAGAMALMKSRLEDERSQVEVGHSL